MGDNIRYRSAGVTLMDSDFDKLLQISLVIESLLFQTFYFIFSKFTSALLSG